MNYLLIKKSINWAFFKIVFLVGLIVVAGGTTYLYFKNAFPLLDISIFYDFLEDFMVAPSSSIWAMLYNNVYLFAPFLLLLIFGIYGFIKDYRNSHFKDKNFQLFLRVSFVTLLIFVLSEMLNLGFFRLDDRFLIYFEFVVVVRIHWNC